MMEKRDKNPFNLKKLLEMLTKRKKKRSVEHILDDVMNPKRKR